MRGRRAWGPPAALLVGAALGACRDGSPASPGDRGPGGSGGDATVADGGASGAPPPTQDVASLLAPIHDAYGGVPGLGALVMRGGYVVALGAAGVRRVGDPTAITPSDLFHLGGDVQSMTATLAAALVEDGTLTWTSRLGDVLSGVPMHASYVAATLEDLLAQRAGAPAVIPPDIVLSARGAGDSSALRQAAVAAVLSRGTDGPAGTFQESDVTFLLAAAMLERAARVPWETLIATRLFAPLGMTTCRSVTADPGPSPPTVPWGHVVDAAGAVTPAAPGGIDEPPAALAPSEGMRCSLEDWARFAALHLAGARGATTTLLHPPSFAKLQTPLDIAHALGWDAVSRPWAGEQLALNCVSRDRSSYALAWLLPSKNAVILVAVNEGGAAASKVADDAVANLVGSIVDAP